MVIDSHQHFWKYDPIKHAWINDDMAKIRKDYLPEDLAKEFAVNNVTGSVAVQASQSLQETDFLLQLSLNYELIRGIVGWVDLRDPGINDTLEHYAQFSKIKGFRHIVQDESDSNFMLRNAFTYGISQLEKYGFTYDILVYPHQLGAVLEFIKYFPQQKFVIDHLAKPYIKDGFFDGWALLMKEISKFPNVYCKISGMLTEANYPNCNYDQFTPFLNHIFEHFGTERLMYGSDWPVCLLAGDYNNGKSIVEKYITNFSLDEKLAVMGQNAIDFYNLH
jgi:L-fuconolactonase